MACYGIDCFLIGWTDIVNSDPLLIGRVSLKIASDDLSQVGRSIESLLQTEYMLLNPMSRD